MAHKEKKPQLTILLFLFSFSNVLGMMYVASLPSLTTFFGIEKGIAQQTIALFLVGYALGQLIYGPLSSALGRKVAIYIGCCLALIGSLICVLAIEIQSFSLLLIGRLVTALGSASGLSMTFTMISDVFTHAEAKKKISLLIGAFALFPAVGIFIGGLLTEYISWKSCFYFMLIYCVFILVLSFFLPETLKEKDSSHLHPLRVLKTYFSHFRHLVFLFCSLILGISGGIIYIFAAEAPYIAINQLGTSPDLFGLLNLIPFFGLFVGGFFSSFISSKLSPKRLILLGTLIYFVSSLIMLASFQLNYVNVNTLFFIPLAIFFSFPLIYSSSSLLGISISPHKSYAASLINFIMLMIAVLIMESLFLFPSPEAVILPAIYSCIGVILIFLWIVLRLLPTEEN